MQIEPVAIFRSPLREKFGVPRQSGLAESLRGTIELLPPYNSPDALRGLDGFDYLWLIWQFHLNRNSGASETVSLPLDPTTGKAGGPLSYDAEGGTGFRGTGVPDKQSIKLTVRPPRLGGNERVGVFASRSPFRPNGLGLSSVRIESIDLEAATITVLGADLADGTPIYDIKPYVEYADSHPGVRSGFVDSNGWEPLEVVFAPEAAGILAEDDARALQELLSQDPRPHYQDSPDRIYGLAYKEMNVRFKVEKRTLTVVSVE